MPQISRNALVAFSAESMFDLVNDIAAYPQFLPGCADANVESENEHEMRASLLIARAGVKQWFTTHNTLERGKFIHMKLVDGPFTHLSGGWTFTPLAEDACKIELSLEFEFSSKLAEMAFGRIFNSIATNMVSAFTQRAKEVYL
ncbi:type II toxin-antitoxin system RatA family toxin [Aestuariibacter sp. AA17]|uniref:Type II toxin-antitoxin system RatA family toxin n=1 Tax=Fluctibacter corallii TaxID=2984329 RepID=A0ABT3A5C5_9ALTE|nr:type II toxin-antitoxin system RatA family toxin [Aestuariibacter sp. AA17]MCV2883886.1 type II toxin-antitoxin system RatA family toxin [Aestuariibacter sp. AA17]